VEPARGGRHSTLLGHGDKGGQLPQLHRFSL
jgi:hypothetical protein